MWKFKIKCSRVNYLTRPTSIIHFTLVGVSITKIIDCLADSLRNLSSNSELTLKHDNFSVGKMFQQELTNGLTTTDGNPSREYGEFVNNLLLIIKNNPVNHFKTNLLEISRNPWIITKGIITSIKIRNKFFRLNISLAFYTNRKLDITLKYFVRITLKILLIL